MILTKLLILISLIIFIFVEHSQKRVILRFIVDNLHLSNLIELVLIKFDKFTSEARRIFTNFFQSRGLRLKRLGGQWSNSYDFEFWGNLKKGDFDD